MLGITLLILYILLILIVTLRVRNKSSVASFFVNNRDGSAKNVALSIIVSCVGASATIGVVGKAFHVGLPAFWWLGAGAVGLTFLAVLLAEKVRGSGAFTLPQMAEDFLGAPARPVISLFIVVAWMGILAAQFSALEQVLVSLTGFSSQVSLAVAFLLVATHSLGGQAVIMRLDSMQSLLMLTGLAFILFWLWAHNPSWIFAVKAEAVNDAFQASDLLYYLFIVGGNYLVCPMLFGRLFSARDAGTARKGGIFAAIGLAICSLLIVGVGLAGVGLIPGDTPQDQVFTSLLGLLSPEWLQPLILVAIISAIVSSADTCLVTASTIFSYDLLRSENMRVCRLSVLGLATVGLTVSCMNKGILEFLLMGYDVYVCGVVVPVFIGLLLRGRFTIHTGYACLAVIAGGSCGALAVVSGQSLFSYAGMGIAALLCLVGLRRQNIFPADEIARESSQVWTQGQMVQFEKNS